MNINRKVLLNNIFNDNNLKKIDDGGDFVNRNVLKIINNRFSNSNIDDILNNISQLLNYSYKSKQFYDIYECMVYDFCINNDKINIVNISLFQKFLKKISSIDKGYILLEHLNKKYNLADYSDNLIKVVLKNGTLTNLLFWKKITSTKYLFTIENLILVCTNSDIRILKYFIGNMESKNCKNFMNNITVSKILYALNLAEHIPLKYKLKRMKLLNNLIDFNQYLDVVFCKLPLHVINIIYKYYNFDNYKLNFNDLEKLNDKFNTNIFYKLTNQYNKNLISLIYLFRGYELNQEIKNNLNEIKNMNNIDNYVIKMLSINVPNKKSFYNYNSNEYNKENYKVMTNIMKDIFKGKNYTLNLGNIWDNIFAYIYYILPFINKINVTDNLNKDISKSYSVLKRFFVKIFNRRIKINYMIKRLNSIEIENNVILDNSTNNIKIVTDKTIIKDGYISYYYNGIITNKLPPNIHPEINLKNLQIKSIYLEEEGLYLLYVDKLNLIENHKYLVDNNIKLNLDNYEKVLNDFLSENNNSNKWFPLLVERVPDKLDDDKEYMYMNDINEILKDRFILIKNKENIYIKLKLVNIGGLKLVDYDNNEYPRILKELIDNLDENDKNSIIKYYPYKKINNIPYYEICYYSIKPNKKDKIDYLLNL